jgi:hypothetical protein
MAGDKVNNYSIGDSNIEELMVTQDSSFKRQSTCSLTEMTTQTVPKISSGSYIECNGTLFKFSSDETLSGSPSNGVVYIRIIPSSTTCTAEMTNTAPVWNDLKQGFYGSGASENYVYLPYLLYKSALGYDKSTWNFKSIIRAYITGQQTGITTATIIRYNTEIIDTLNEFDVSTYTFTPTRGGLYRVSSSVLLGNNSAAITQFSCVCNKSAFTTKATQYTYVPAGGAAVATASLAFTDFFASGSTVNFNLVSSSSISTFPYSSEHCFLCIEEI